MSNYSVMGSTTGQSLGLLFSEAESLLKQAKEYKTLMDALPPNDAQRAIYEKIITDLLDRANKLSFKVTTAASK